MNFFDRIQRTAQQKKTLLCVGLDPRIDKSSSVSPVEQIILKNKALIDQTLECAVCYKPNMAFYEAWGSKGMEALEETLAYINKRLPVIIDAKRGDIGSTAEAYAACIFGHLDADAVTIAPYMGENAVEPFLAYKDKGIFVLCKTSNPSSTDLQMETIAGKGQVYEHIAKRFTSLSSRIGLVVAGNDVEALTNIRAICPEAWFLAPGIGAQGGTMKHAIEAGMNASGSGIIPVVVRSIANAPEPAAKAAEYREAINSAGALKPAASRSPIPHLKKRVLEGIINNGCFQIGEFTLKSGKKSPFYIDLRKLISDPVLMSDVGQAYSQLLSACTYDRIAGIPTAGLPLAAAASLAAGRPMIYPRIPAKPHGTQNRIEGTFNKEETAVMLDDLISTGASKIEAAEVLKQERLTVKDLVVLIERGTQGKKDMENAGIKLHSFAVIEELFAVCRQKGIIDSKKEQELIQFVREG